MLGITMEGQSRCCGDLNEGSYRIVLWGRPQENGSGLELGEREQEKTMSSQGCHVTSEEVSPTKEAIDGAWDKPQEKLWARPGNPRAEGQGAFPGPS